MPGPDPAALLAAIERERVTKLFCPPTVWIGLLRSPEFDRTDLSSLRKGYYGASAMPVEVLRELRRRLPDVDLWNFYGQTEMAPLATILRPHEQLERAGSAGIAALNVETRVVDEEDQPLPPGEIGEIVHRSPHATLGYYEDPEKTAEAFRNGWFHSGDLGVLTEDGYLSVVDRKKDMIKTGGENVASREVEEALYELDGVAEVAVFGVSHPRWIEAVVAVVVPKPGSDVTEADVEAHARSPARRLQAPEVRGADRRAAEEPEREDPQARAPGQARDARRRLSPAGSRRRELSPRRTGGAASRPGRGSRTAPPRPSTATDARWRPTARPGPGPHPLVRHRLPGRTTSRRGGVGDVAAVVGPVDGEQLGQPGRAPRQIEGADPRSALLDRAVEAARAAGSGGSTSSPARSSTAEAWPSGPQTRFMHQCMP